MESVRQLRLRGLLAVKAPAQRGSEPGQTLGELFRLRHDLVHPKMRQVRVDGVTLIDERFEKFNPKSAAEFLVAVADAAYALAERQDPTREPDATVVGVRREREQLTGSARRCARACPLRSLPRASARTEEDVIRSTSIRVPHDAAKFLTAISEHRRDGDTPSEA